MKRISMFLVLAFVLTAVVASANPFSDVPFSHWAYDAVNKLAAKNLLQGYPDGTFKGEKHVTRYALAMVTAKMLANVEQMMEKGFGNNLVTKSDLQTLEKLTVEFADELALLGVKVTALEDDMQVVKEDVSTLKKDVEGIKDYMAKGGMEKVKLSGDMLIRHSSLIHNRDWNIVGGNIGNSNNAQTQTQLRFQFKANIDENVTAVARWHMLNKSDSSLNTANNITAWGAPNAFNDASSNIDLAYLQVKDMFRFGGDFIFGRNFYATGHSLLLSNYADAIVYKKRSGDIDIGALTIYGRHQGNYNDQATNNGVDFRNIWGLLFGGKYHDHDLYLNLFATDEINLGRRLAGMTFVTPALVTIPTPAIALSNTVAGCQQKDSLMDVEFGGKGPLGKNGHWDYDLGFAYTGYQMDRVQNVAGTIQDVSMCGWMGTMAVKWDSKKEWAAKLGYTFADDKALGVLSLNNDRRYDDGVETPYEDIARGNTYFRNGLMNMYDLKVQVEYRPRNTKHYFRLAGDFLGEMKDQVSNDITRLISNGHISGTPDVPAGSTKVNTVYDQWNNFGTDKPEANVLTFEYRYQLAENTRIRVGYTAFDMTGTAVRSSYQNGVLVPAQASISAGRGTNGDYKYNTFWAELYSRF